MTGSMEPGEKRVADEEPYTNTAMRDHERTFARVMGLFKYLIIAVAFILLFLLVAFH